MVPGSDVAIASTGWEAYLALQQDGLLKVWPGGQTALALQGYSHYLPLGEDVVTLFAPWFKTAWLVR